MEEGGREVKSRPEGPVRCRERGCGSGVQEEESARAMSLVLPRKRLGVVRLMSVLDLRLGRGRIEVGRGDKPAVGKVRADLFEEGVAHVGDREDEAVLVFVEAFLDAGEKLLVVLFAFLVDFCQVDDFGALGFGHCCCC